jgi:hypothetical protein
VGIELVLLALLQVKHFLGDFVFQTENQARNKGIYGHPAGLVHAATQAALTVPCLIAVGVEPLAIAVVTAIEFILHYHQDWLKERISARFRGAQSTKAYWVMFGADQLLHQMFYLALVFVLFQGIEGFA